MGSRNTQLATYLESYHNKINVTNFGANVKDNEPRWKRAAPAGTGRGVKLDLFPPAMSSAPFLYKDAMTNLQHEMAFFGGVTCLVQHESGAIEPRMGWAVLDSGRQSGI